MRIAGIGWENKSVTNGVQHTHVIKITVMSDPAEGVPGFATKSDAIDALTRIARTAIHDQLIKFNVNGGEGV